MKSGQNSSQINLMIFFQSILTFSIQSYGKNASHILCIEHLLCYVEIYELIKVLWLFNESQGSKLHVILGKSTI